MKRLPPGASIVDRIAYRVCKDRSSGCWIWTGHVDAWGYGRINVRKRCALAHRESYLASVGPIPDGLVLRHLCGNPACVNPEHLEPGTALDNYNDAVKHGTMRRKISEIEALRVAMAVRYGDTLTEAGAPFGWAKDVAWRALRVAARLSGVPVEDLRRPKLAKEKATPTRREIASMRRQEARVLLDGGLNQRTVAKHMGLSEASISLYQKKHRLLEATRPELFARLTVVR